MDAVIVTEREKLREEVAVTEVRNRLAEVLTEKGMTLRDLERETILLGERVSYQTLLDITHNRLSGITFRVMAIICEAMGTAIGEVWYLEGQSRNGKEAPKGG